MKKGLDFSKNFLAKYNRSQSPASEVVNTLIANINILILQATDCFDSVVNEEQDGGKKKKSKRYETYKEELEKKTVPELKKLVDNNKKAKEWLSNTNFARIRKINYVNALLFTKYKLSKF